MTIKELYEWAVKNNVEYKIATIKIINTVSDAHDYEPNFYTYYVNLNPNIVQLNEDKLKEHNSQLTINSLGDNVNPNIHANAQFVALNTGSEFDEYDYWMNIWKNRRENY